MNLSTEASLIPVTVDSLFNDYLKLSEDEKSEFLYMVLHTSVDRRPVYEVSLILFRLKQLSNKMATEFENLENVFDVR